MGDQSLFHVLAWSAPAEGLLHEVNKMVEGMNVVVDTLFLFDRSEQRESITEHFWTDDAHPQMTIALVNDHSAESDYLYVIGPEGELVFDVWNNLRVMLPVVGLDELKRAASVSNAAPHSLQRLAWGAGTEYDGTVHSIVTNALSSSDRLVRNSAVTAILTLRWQVFLAPLRVAAMNTEDRREADAMEYVCRILEGQSQ